MSPDRSPGKRICTINLKQFKILLDVYRIKYYLCVDNIGNEFISSWMKLVEEQTNINYTTMNGTCQQK